MITITNNFIIGGGKTAALANIVYPDYTTISPESQSPLDICYVWDTLSSRKFLEKYNIKFSVVTRYNHRIGNDVTQYNKLTMKKNKSVPSSGKSSFNELFFSALNSNININDSIELLNLDTSTLYTKLGNNIKFKNLIIASPITFNIIYKEKLYEKVKYYPISFVKIKSQLQPTTSDYFYTMDNEYLSKKLYRIIKLNNGQYSLEFACDKKDATKNIKALKIALERDFGTFEVIDISVNNFGHFKDANKQYLKAKNAKFISRYSRLNNDWMLHDTMSELLK